MKKKSSPLLIPSAFAFIASLILLITSTAQATTSLTQLKASHGGCYCVPDPNCDCRSSETGNIYAGHRMVCSEIELMK